MNIDQTELDGVILITPQRHGDDRGWFSETYRQSALVDAGFSGGEFVQDNHVRSTNRGILRGLHFQSPPFAQDKLVRCLRGAIFDVAVDIRKGSPTYGAWVGAEISADNARQILVPRGYAHGYCTLTDECEVSYKVTAYYDKASEGGLRWNDPAIGIQWPIAAEDISTNARDAALPTLAELISPF